MIRRVRGKGGNKRPQVMLDSDWVRFESKVIRTDGCHHWIGPDRGKGYGAFQIGNKTHTAHRLAYEKARGPIPDGMVLDHLCRNRGCVNPEHLEPVTAGENVMRGETRAAANAAKTHCIHGHPLSGENLFIRRSGSRDCRECMRQQCRRSAAKKRSAALGSERVIISAGPNRGWPPVGR